MISDLQIPGIGWKRNLGNLNVEVHTLSAFMLTMTVALTTISTEE